MLIKATTKGRDLLKTGKYEKNSDMAILEQTKNFGDFDGMVRTESLIENAKRLIKEGLAEEVNEESYSK